MNVSVLSFERSILSCNHHMVPCHLHSCLSLEQWLIYCTSKNICRDSNELMIIKKTHKNPVSEHEDLGYHLQPLTLIAHRAKASVVGGRKQTYFYVFHLLSSDKISPCSPDWTQTHNPPASPSQVLESQVYSTKPSSPFINTSYSTHIIQNTLTYHTTLHIICHAHIHTHDTTQTSYTTRTCAHTHVSYDAMHILHNSQHTHIYNAHLCWCIYIKINKSNNGSPLMANGVVEPEAGPTRAGGWQTLTRPDSNMIRSFMQCRKRGHTETMFSGLHTHSKSYWVTQKRLKRRAHEAGLTWGLWDSCIQG